MSFEDFDAKQKKSGNMMLNNKRWFNVALYDINHSDYLCNDDIPAQIRIINAKKMLSIYLKKNSKHPDISFRLKDETIKENNRIFEIHNGKLSVHKLGFKKNYKEFSIKELADMIFKKDHLKMQYMLCSELKLEK